MCVSVPSELEDVFSPALSAAHVSPACVCVAMASPTRSVWDEAPRSTAAPPLGQSEWPDVEQRRGATVWALTRGRRAHRRTRPGPRKRVDGALPAKPPPARGTMTMEQLREAVAALPQKKASVARTRSPVAMTPPGGRPRGEVTSASSAGVAPSPAQAGKGLCAPAT